MNSITDLKKGVKAKEYFIKHFSGSSLVDDRDEWLIENPNVIIFNTHIFVNNGTMNHVFEYIKT